jgi:YidC/Oxa1 family membrane protein insertase
MRAAWILYLNPTKNTPMDNIRLFLLGTFAFLSLLLYNEWQEDYVLQPPTATTSTQSGSSVASTPGGVPDVAASTLRSVTATDVPGVMPTATPVSFDGDVVKVTTDLFEIEISTVGGSIVSAKLLDYPVSPKTPDLKFHLLNRTTSDPFIAQSGLIATEAALAPNHEALFTAEQSEYQLADGADTLSVKMSWQQADGIAVIKQFVFSRDSYRIDVIHQVNNGSDAAWTARDYAQLMRGEPGETNSFIYTYTGGVVYSPETKYEKYDFGEMADADLNRDDMGGWVAMIQHYFLAAWVPPKEQKEHFYSSNLGDNRYIIGSYSPAVTLQSGESHHFSKQLFVGPKLQDKLLETAPGLELTVDYGWLTVIAQPIYWLLQKLHDLVGNWGWSIILLTLLIKAAFFKLSEASYKSMANMRRMTPRMTALKDRYGDDKARLNKAMMDLYKTEKINPLGGCLPMLVQIPVFIALYWVLLESVELRQAPFILWMDNLSEKDPYFILPLIMGVSMFIQQKLNPTPPDPIQAKMMMALPFVFTIFFAFFPSGLVLYWVVNNLISITQQYIITRRIEAQAEEAKKS